MSLSGTWIGDEAGLRVHLDAWDRLAVSIRRPYAAPAWGLAWWRHAAPPGTLLRIAVLHQRDELVAVAPMFAERVKGIWQYRWLASPISQRVAPICRPGEESAVAAALASMLSNAEPAPAMIRFDGIDSNSPWPKLIADAWPARSPAIVETGRGVAPTLALEGLNAEDWWKAQSQNWRRGMRRDRRALASAEAIHRVCPSAEIRDGVRELIRLHRGRWEWRGGSAALAGGLEEMLVDAGSELTPKGRLRLFEIRVDGRSISSMLVLAAGGEVCAWIAGFDDAWEKRHPGLMIYLDAIEDALERGETRLDLGHGDQPYKQRFADGADELRWATLLIRRGTAWPLASGLLAAERLRPQLARVRAGLSRRLRARLPARS